MKDRTYISQLSDMDIIDLKRDSLDPGSSFHRSAPLSSMNSSTIISTGIINSTSSATIPIVETAAALIALNFQVKERCRRYIQDPNALNQRYLPDKTLKRVSGPPVLGHSQQGWPDHLIYYCHSIPCFVILHVSILTFWKIINWWNPFGTFIW